MFNNYTTDINECRRQTHFGVFYLFIYVGPIYLFIYWQSIYIFNVTSQLDKKAQTNEH